MSELTRQALLTILDITSPNQNLGNQSRPAMFIGRMDTVGDSLVRPATDKQHCILCRYCFSDVHGDLKCLFLFEMAMFHKIKPSVDCPILKEDNDI